MAHFGSFVKDFLGFVCNFGIQVTCLSLLLSVAFALDLNRYGFEPFKTGYFIFGVCETVFLITAVRLSYVQNSHSR